MKKIFTFLMLAAAMIVATSCSKDDEPGAPTYDGVSIYLNAIETLYNSDGDPAFTPTTTDGIYVAVASTPQVARDYLSRLIGNNDWDGKNVTIPLGENGESGSLKIISQNLEAGIYDEVIVNIKGYTPFTLHIIDEERAKDDNGNGYIGEGIVRL